MGDLAIAALEVLELVLTTGRRWPKAFAALLVLLVILVWWTSR
jgi:hypothetical protein